MKQYNPRWWEKEQDLASHIEESLAIGELTMNVPDLLVCRRVADVFQDAPLLSERSLVAQQTLRISGDPYVQKYVARFLARVEVQENGCWYWQSTLNNKGYARMGMYRRPVLVHRWSYLLLKGAIPQGLELDHLCRHPQCVNPDHLDPVTHRENNLRGNTIAAIHARTTHCPQGHAFDEENTRITKKGGRECRICKREKARPYHKILTSQRTHCPQGHLYDAENTGIRKDGRRYCKACYKVRTPTYWMEAKGRKNVS